VTDEQIQVAHFDTGEFRLHFDALHPLIAESAATAWVDGDYPAAVKAAWFALRDLARQRLDEPNLDGVQLMERIGDTDPRLPLTEMANDTERDMHRGVWRFLAGTAFYIRNPEMHQSVSPIHEDRVGAFERLVVMSICARHLDAASSPVSVDEAVAEASQVRFPNTIDAADDLVHSVSTGQRTQLVEGLMDALAVAALAGDEQQAITLRLVYQRALHRLGPDDAPVRIAAGRCERWVADDSTLGLAILMLTSTTYGLLKRRHQDKVAFRLIEDIKAGIFDGEGVSGAQFEVEIGTIFDGMPAQHRTGVLRAVVSRLVGTPEEQAYGTRLVSRLCWVLQREEAAMLASPIASVLLVERASEAKAYVELVLGVAPPAFTEPIRDALADLYEPDLPREHALRRVLAELGVDLPDPPREPGA
jgi:uncharacterized protein (TIGR02391 family)